MNRLQEYLKTPNPLNFQLFIQPTYQQENTPHLFSEHDVQLIKGNQQQYMEKCMASPKESREAKESPIIKIVYKNEAKIIQEKLMFEDMSDEVIETPMEKVEKTSFIQTTAQKKYDLRITGPLAPEIMENKEGERSLRVLTSEAYNVVCKKGPLTYKLVAQQIINDTCDLGNIRQQNNIKRRVYDALNILIALGKLEKKGRRIFLRKDLEEDRVHQQKIGEFKKIIHEKQQIIIAKRKNRKSSSKKISLLKKLIIRNKNVGDKNKISMPFIMLKCQGIKTINEKDDTHIKVSIKNKEQDIIYGDLDVLGSIKFLGRQ